MPDTCTGPKPTCSAGTEPTCVLNYWHCAVTFVTPTPPPQGVVPQVSQNGCTVTNNTDQSVRVCAFSGGCEGDFSGRCGPSWNQINNEQGGAKCINLTAHGNTNLCQPATVQCGSWQTDISIANNPDGTAAVAGINTSGCTSTPPGGGNPPGTTPPGGNPPGTTPPTGGGPQCTNIKIYKDGAQVTPSTLRPGDNILIAVAGTGATKAHIRVNGADWIETTTTNSNNEFTVPFTIPSGVTNFTIEAEIYVSGVWQ
ncbi:hypothetical protein M1555_03380 [Patescibacteria group bacterium]|nr:hypothetical protein [Patescibacteria group bacterium]